MCTETKLFDLVSWWSIWIVIGIGACLLLFDKLCKVRKVTEEANRFYYFLGIIAIVVGFLMASLVQSCYNYLESVAKGNPKWEWGGVTFMGGLFGGVIAFVGGALIFAKGNVRAQFGQVCEIGLACVPTAHAFGRIGCFSVGCCYGAEVHEGDPFAFLGVTFKHGAGAGVLRYPTQLFEAVFLFILAGVCILMVLKDKKFNSVIYFAAYGIFRFCLEFLRDDDRGVIGIGFVLTPSQVLSIVSVVIALLMLTLILLKKYAPAAALKVAHFFRLDVPFNPELEVKAVLPESDDEEDENDLSEDEKDKDEDKQ